jgi:S-DNA-T family DNA segregation ATPase FtsK/SpoIIIE
MPERSRLFRLGHESVFDEFGIEAVVADQTDGPSVTRYEVMLGRGVKVEKVAGLQKNIAYATAAESVRILAPIPDKSAVGIELPKEQREIVTLASRPATGHALTVYVGEDVEGEAVTANLADLPHLLVAGTTGSGKSSFINSVLVPLLDADPSKVQLLLIDPKMV